MKSHHASQRPAGVTALALFFIFGALVSALSAISLISHSAMLEPMWQIKPAARVAFYQMGVWAPILLGAVCLACAAAAFGFFAGAKWGYRLGIGILLLNLIGDVVNALVGVEPRAWIGVPIVALLLWYLSSRKVRAFFLGARPNNSFKPKPLRGSA